MSDRKKYGKYLLIYTALFSIIFLLVFSPFLLEGKNLIGKGDGQSQYILQLRYMGEWLRKTAGGFLHGDFHPDRFDYTIGMGDDINAVVRFHPLDFLSIFVPASGTEALYCVLTVLRCFLAGLSLSAFVFHFRKSRTAALSGALLYVFCGFTFGLGIVHPTYLSHMILFPLMLLGAERMMDPERKHSFALFTVCVALGFISNYYFMYISSFGLLGYVLIRFFDLYRTDRLKQFGRLLISLSLAYLLGLALSGIFLFPALARYKSSLRAVHEAERNSLLVYEDKRRYLAWFLNLITPYQASGNGTHLNFAVTLMPAAALIFSSAKRKSSCRQIRTGLIVLLFCLLIPGAGYVLAAMNNENNRWVYLIAFAAAVAVSFTADAVSALQKRDRRFLLLVTAVFDLGCAVWFWMTREAVFHLTAAVELTLYTAVLLYLSCRTEKKKKKADGYGGHSHAGRNHDGYSYGERIVLLFTAGSAALAGWMTFSPRFGNLAAYYQEQGTAFSRYEESSYAVYTDTPLYTGENGAAAFSDGFYRVDSVRSAYWEDNSSLVLRQPGVQIYNSIVNASQLQAMIEQRSTGMTSILHIQSLDGRTALEALAGVRYFAVDADNAASLPYGYAKQPLGSRRKLALYENQYPLPFGFTTDTVISREDYEALNPAAKDLVMLRAAVTEDSGHTAESGQGQRSSALTDETKQERASVSAQAGEAGQAQSTGLTTTDGKEEEVSVLREGVSFEAGDGVTRKGSRLVTGKKGGSLSVSYEKKAGYECYLSLESLRLLGGHSLSAAAYVKANGISKGILLSAANSAYTRGDDAYIVNLGTASGDGTGILQLILPEEICVSLEKSELLYLPMADYEEKVKRLSEVSLQHVTFDGDSVSGEITLNSPRYMVFQIPYSSGWTIEVNGKQKRPERADLCYLGVRLEKGTSQIRLVYHSPGLRAGILCSSAGLVLFAAAFALSARRRRLRKAGNDRTHVV
ncbi:YfhO family protein [Porcincola intestinalis]|uniref:YfhO family protein n=1 Tax=Porcincola intestinalis TaxID=2606632 RepID=UPI002A9124CE|nr:YfhO family protein [Porcincola intestinalis]MDY5578693.1 YfhO family protein [Porcincola intestinalis]